MSSTRLLAHSVGKFLVSKAVVIMACITLQITWKG